MSRGSPARGRTVGIISLPIACQGGNVMESTAAIDDSSRWTEALAAVGLGEDVVAPAPDLCLFFASPAYEDVEALVEQAYQRTAASVLIGCGGQGVVGPEREVE